MVQSVHDIHEVFLLIGAKSNEDAYPTLRIR